MKVPLGFVVVRNHGDTEAVKNYGTSSVSVKPGECRAVLRHVADDLRALNPACRIDKTFEEHQEVQEKKRVRRRGE